MTMASFSPKIDIKLSKPLERLGQLNKTRAGVKNGSGQEELSAYRHTTQKLLQHTQSSDRYGRDAMLQDSVTLDTLLSTLEFSDRQVMMNIVNVILELLGKTNATKRASYFVSSGTQTLIFTLSREYHVTSPADDVLIAINQILAKIAPKDKKFCVKMRLGQGLPVLLYLLRNHITGGKNIQAVLQVLKIVSANTVNASYLGKNGAVTYLYKIMQVCGKRRVSQQKLALDSLSSLLKSKSNSARAVGQGLVPYLLSQFQDWHKLDTKHKHISFRKAILLVLKNITNLKSGRRALLEADGVRILYNTCKEVLTIRDMEGVVITASTIMRKCFPKCRLPIAKLDLLTFPLPESDLHLVDWCLGGSVKSDTASSIDDNDDSSVDNDDDVSSEEEARDCSNKVAPEEPRLLREAPPTRSPDDLFMYQKFFPEQFEILTSPESRPEEAEAAATTIYIPTVEPESDRLSTRRSAPDCRVKLVRSYTDLRHQFKPAFLTEVRDDIPLLRASTQHQGLNLFPTHTPPDLFIKGRTFDIPAKSSPCDVDVRTRRRTSDSYTPTVLADKYSNIYDRPDLYQELALKTRSVVPFTKVPYPEMNGHRPTPFLPALYKRKFSVLRNKTYADIDRWLNPDEYSEQVVYDLDLWLADEERSEYEKQQQEPGQLKFNSRFESGNLRKAIQVAEHEYDLLLCPDVNTGHHHQWFYFEVSNTMADVTYRFNIINCEKNNSQFNFGMKPVIYSHKEALLGRPYWQRAGFDICYYKNHYRRQAPPGAPCTSQNLGAKTHYTASFCVKFPYSGDVCYIAYHYPYTYSTLQAHLNRLERNLDAQSVYYRHDGLCETLGGNAVPLVTITAYPQSDTRQHVEEMRNRPYIFLTARVHPGESNASWVMKGTLQFLLSDHPTAIVLRNKYIFKIVPMLNPDGVINGNDRCSLAGEDLNRRWYHPCPKLHPTIYHTKGLLQYMKLIGKTPVVFCDYHGHSRKKNVFMYGCSAFDSWLADDTDNPNYVTRKCEDESYKHLPHLLHRFAPSFSLSGCSFMVEKGKESTARVVVWRQMRIVRSYTMESTFCGCQQGIYKGLQIGTRELEEMGEKFAEVLLKLKLTTADTALEAEGDADAISTIAELASATRRTLDLGTADYLDQASTASDDDEEEDEDDEDYYDDYDDYDVAAIRTEEP